MNAKNLLAAALLIFVASSAVILVGREMQEQDPEEAIPAAQLPENALMVYYFHGEVRCPTCRQIESLSHEAVHAGFAEELEQDKLLWKSVNYDQPENAHFADEYEVAAPSVVLVRIVAGKPATWRNLDRVWELVGDPTAFAEYIQAETRSLLGT